MIDEMQRQDGKRSGESKIQCKEGCQRKSPSKYEARMVGTEVPWQWNGQARPQKLEVIASLASPPNCPRSPTRFMSLEQQRHFYIRSCGWIETR